MTLEKLTLSTCIHTVEMYYFLFLKSTFVCHHNAESWKTWIRNTHSYQPNYCFQLAWNRLPVFCIWQLSFELDTKRNWRPSIREMNKISVQKKVSSHFRNIECSCVPAVSDAHVNVYTVAQEGSLTTWTRTHFARFSPCTCVHHLCAYAGTCTRVGVCEQFCHRYWCTYTDPWKKYRWTVELQWQIYFLFFIYFVAVRPSDGRFYIVAKSLFRTSVPWLYDK